MALPAGASGNLRVPVLGASKVEMRSAPLTDRDVFDPKAWVRHALGPDGVTQGWWQIDLDAQELADGVYEYEFIVDGDDDNPVADPYADEITRFGGYRGLFRIRDGVRIKQPFRWANKENQAQLPANNTIVIYEMPIKWMANDPVENPTVELGTFDKLIFEKLDYLKRTLGINCIELLPVEDSSQTLDWGYGTRFFFAPDYDMGSPIDLKFFMKSCHEMGIRVILDVVMDFSDVLCPLNQVASAWFYDPDWTDNRDPWGGRLFKYNTYSHDSAYEAREFLYSMAEYWVTEYHIDGFRIDDFADIQNWDFGQTFKDRATAASTALDPAKPFIVIAEDSNGRFQLTNADALNNRPVFGAIWNFNYMREIRQLLLDQIDMAGVRSDRVRHLLSKDGPWNGYGYFDPGYTDMTNAICYSTSHDVADKPRMMNVILGDIITRQQLGSGDVNNIKSIIDGAPTDNRIIGAVQFALYRILGCFALLLTSVGIPMFLAGEEFGDVHDVPYSENELKQQDPVQWERAKYVGQKDLLSKVGALIALRTGHRALQMNDIDSFYFHPTFDQQIGTRVFAYARTAGTALGSAGQVVVIANMGGEKFPAFGIPHWPWGDIALTEIANPGVPAPVYDGAGDLILFLDAFQVRVFTT